MLKTLAAIVSPPLPPPPLLSVKDGKQEDGIYEQVKSVKVEDLPGTFSQEYQFNEHAGKEHLAAVSTEVSAQRSVPTKSQAKNKMRANI
jgi:hypothetical protein